MPNSTPVYLEALTCLENHISIIPISPAGQRGSKRPAVPWKTYQTQRATREDAYKWFAQKHHGLAAVCGEISGGLIMIELEGRAAEKLPQLRETSRRPIPQAHHRMGGNLTLRRLPLLRPHPRKHPRQPQTRPHPRRHSTSRNPRKRRIHSHSPHRRGIPRNRARMDPLGGRPHHAPNLHAHPARPAS